MSGSRERVEMSGSREPKVVGAILVVAAATMYGVAVVIQKWVASQGLPTESTLAVRFGISALVLAMILLATRTPLDAAPRERRWLILLGAVGYAIEASFFFGGLQHGTAAAVTLLFYTYPVLLAVAHIVLGRGRLNRFLVGGLALSLTGTAIVIVSSGGVQIDGVGVLLTLCASVSFTLYVLGSEFSLKRTRPLTSAMWLCASATAGLVVLAVASGEFVLPRSSAESMAVAATGVATAGAFVCFLAGLRRVGSVRTGIISTFEPLSAALLAFLFLAEPLGLGIIAGGVFIMAGSVAAVLSGRQRGAEAEAEGGVPDEVFEPMEPPPVP